MKKNIWLITIAGVLLMNTSFLIYSFYSKPKLAYVKSQELVLNYMGMKEAQSKFQLRQTQLFANVDTLKFEFEKSVEKFNSDFDQLSQQDKDQKHARLKAQENNINRYTESIQSQLEEEENQMLSGVLNQVNSFIESYGTEKGYELIFGTTNDGSLLYGKDAHDLTDEILHAMNQNYKGS
ncbi:MAG: OmpH family outer membrane protein [Bacteroidota bacterium]